MFVHDSKINKVLGPPCISNVFLKIGIKTIWKMVFLKVGGSSEYKNLSHLY